jgi:hypothetical protein
MAAEHHDEDSLLRDSREGLPTISFTPRFSAVIRQPWDLETV